jgi:hypothetical protein
MRVFEKRIFGPKRDEVTRELRRLHNEYLYALYSSPNIIRVIELKILRGTRHVARVRQRRGVYRVLVERPEGKSALSRHKHRWEDNIKMDTWEVG